MSDMTVEISDITIDCREPETLARFWSSLLQRPIEGRKGPYVWLARSNGLGLGFQLVEEVKCQKNRVHLDVSGPDVSHIKKQVEALGGTRVEGYEEGGFLVMADPEGNEFCIVPQTLNFDDSGRADYLDELNL